MPLIFIMILISLPAMVLVAAGLAMTTGVNEHDFDRRWTTFLLIAAILMSLPLAIFGDRVRTGTYGLVLILEFPALIAVLSMLLINVRKIFQSWTSDRLLYTMMLAALALLFGRMAISSFTSAIILMMGAIVLSLVWLAIRAMRGKVLTILGACLLTLVFLEAIGVLDQHFIYVSPLLRSAYKAAGIMAVVFTPLFSIALIARGLESGAESQKARRDCILGISLSIAFIASLFRHGLIVNATGHASEDHMPFVAVGMAVIAGIFLAFNLNHNAFKFGMGYALIMAVLITLSYAAAWIVDPVRVTMNRAENIQQALEHYKHEQGIYPSNLNQLSPSYLIHIRRPFTGRGQIWCYQGGEAFYRLGYAYYQRYYYGSPLDPLLEIRIVDTAGDSPDGPWMCDQELELIRATRGL
jgi:hypothetical protein